MERKIENVDRIVIDENEIAIHSGRRCENFNRGKWEMHVENIIQLEDKEVREPQARAFLSHPYARTTMYFGAGVDTSCRILEDEKEIFCSRKRF
ncbi:hypothetical protein ES703_70815 [subsurface metagenome]